MNTRWSRFAPLGLYLAATSAIVSMGLYIVLQTFSLPLQISLGMIIIGLALAVLMDPDRARRAIAGRQAKYGSNALLLTLAVLGILAVINFLGYQNSRRWDLTADKQNTLSKETLATLSSLTQPVKAEAFFSSRLSTDSARFLLESFQYNSKGMFTFEFIDPDANPIAAQNAGVSRDGTAVLVMNGHQEQVTYLDEQEITSALIRLTNPGKRAVYFLSGHGEYDPNGTDETAYAQIKSMLAAKNYTVATLNLIATPTVPDDALAIVIAGLRKPLTQVELDALKKFVSQGKSLIILSEPPVVSSLNNTDDLLQAYLAASWGVSLGDNIIVDPGANPPLVAVANTYDNHPITQRMNRVMTIFPTARSVSVAAALDSVTALPIINTSANAWGETDMQSLQNKQVSVDRDKDLVGPVPLAVAASNKITNARVVVIGDADFASDKYVQQYGNADLMINSIDWAAHQDNLINLTPRTTTTRVLIPPKQNTLGLLLFITVFVLPGLVIFMGISTWLQRRRHG